MGGNNVATLLCCNIAILQHGTIGGGLVGELKGGSACRLFFIVLMHLGKMMDAARKVRWKLGRCSAKTMASPWWGKVVHAPFCSVLIYWSIPSPSHRGY